MQFSLQYQVNREELYSLFINHRGIDFKKKNLKPFKMAAMKFEKKKSKCSCPVSARLISYRTKSTMLWTLSHPNVIIPYGENGYV